MPEPGKENPMELVKGTLHKLKNTGFFHIFGFSVINKIFGFAGGIIIVRLVSKSEYGLYANALNLISFFLLLSGMGMVSGAFQLCSENAEDPERREQIFAYGTRFGILFNLAMSLVILLVASFAKLSLPAARPYFILMAFFPLVEIFFQFQQIYLRSAFKNREYAYATTINAVFVLAGSVLGSILFQVKGLIIGHYLAFILTFLLIGRLYQAKIQVKKTTLSPATRKTLFHLSFISMCNNGVSSLLNLLDIFVIGIVIPNEKVTASYKVASTFPTAAVFIPAALVVYIYPYFAAHRTDGVWTRSTFRQVFKWNAILNGILTLLMLVLAPYIIQTVYGNQYADAVPCFQILMVSYFFKAAFRTLAGNLLVTQRKITFNFVVALVSGLLNVVGNFIMVQKMGSIGAAITTLGVCMFAGLWSFVYYLRTIRNIPPAKNEPSLP